VLEKRHRVWTVATAAAFETELDRLAEADRKIHLEGHLKPDAVHQHSQRNCVRPDDVLDLPKWDGADGTVMNVRDDVHAFVAARRRERREERRCLLLLRRSVAHGDRFSVFFVF